MRKIYSLVLIAAALLIGTNVWATLNDTPNPGVDEAKVTKDGGTTWKYAETLKEAFDFIGENQTGEIVLLKSISVEAPITMPASIPTDAQGKGTLPQYGGQNITLKLAGNNITTESAYVTPFRILKGSLDIEGNGTITKKHTNTSSGEPDWYGGAVIAIAGAQDKTAANWSVLTIGKDVTLIFETETKAEDSEKVLKAKTIAVTNFAGMGYNGTGKDDFGARYGDASKRVDPTSASQQIDKYGYCTRAAKSDVWSGTPDSHGTIESIPTAIQNNSAKLPMEGGALSTATTYHKGQADEATYYKGILQGCAFGVKVFIKGTIVGSQYAIHAHGNINQTPQALENGATARTQQTAPYYQYQYPYIKIEKTATIQAANLGGCIGAYAAGYAVWDIEGDVMGASGVYMKSGDIVLNDATITSTYSGNTTNWGTFGDGGVHGAGGSAIVVESSDAYAGNSGVTVSGDTKVTGGGGYAILDQTTISEGATDGDKSTTSHVTIEGGTIEGGNAGAINIAEGTVDVTTIAGGNVDNSTVTVTYNDQSTDEVAVTSLLIPNTHTTVVEGEGGKTVVVVSAGDPPAETTGDATITSTYDDWDKTGDAPSVKWTKTSETLYTDVTLKELEINETFAQVLTVNDGVTLTIDRVVLGANAQIIVKPTAVLVVKGTQGIVAPVTSNIVLQAEAGRPSIFLFNPNVTSNRHPNATVEFITNSYYTSSSDFRNQRMGIPTYTPIKSMTVTSLDGTTPVQAGVSGYYNGEWNILGYINVGGQPSPVSKMTDPFAYYQLSCNVADGTKSRITMTGELVGNVDHNFNTPVGGGWCTFANSYSGIMSTQEMMAMFAPYSTDANLAQTIWTYKTTGTGNEYAWKSFNQANIAANKMGNLDPMQAFLLKPEDGAVSYNLGLKYDDMVYTPRITTSSLPQTAPARADGSDMLIATINVSKNNDWKDGILMLESDQFSAEYENGYDAEKCMNEFVNIFVTAEKNYSNFVTDNLANTYLGFSCAAGGVYELSFEDIENAEYAILDLVTNQRISMQAGNTYEFTVDDNYANDYRFKIVNIMNMPTSVEETESMAEQVSGIYSITGQYLGNMSMWNSLPSGLYIVDGVKKVK